MKYLFCLSAAIILCAPAFGNSPDSVKAEKHYHVNRPIVGAIIAAGLFSDYFAISRIKGKANISDEELHAINPDILNSMDRWGLQQNPADRDRYKQYSDIGQIPVILLPCLLAFDKKISKDWWDLLLMYAEGHTITFTMYNYSPLGPTFQNKYRPMAYYSEFTNSERESGNNRNSFYSGHVASCAYSTFFMAKVYCDYHPDMGCGKYLWYTAAAVPPLVMSYLRVKALDHFPSDDAVGLALGAAIGIIIPQLHKVSFNKDVSFGMFTSPDAMGLSVRWTLHKPIHNSRFTMQNESNGINRAL
jgi:hypothetical protein